MEKATLSKEILETTRIGRYVNEVRKHTADCWPEFSKRCRSIIKQWQKIAEYRPSSSCEGSSNGGTPQLVSPALRRGLTPRTPGKQTSNQRVTSAEFPTPDARNISTGLSTIASPVLVENGVISESYSPPTYGITKKISPQMLAVVQQTKQVHKSASMGNELSTLHEQTSNDKLVNIKDLANGTLGEGSLRPRITDSYGQPPLTLKLKRSASGVQRLTMTSTESNVNTSALSNTAVSSSVQAARKNVQSTAELVAQLSEQLPSHIAGIFDRNTVADNATDSKSFGDMSYAASTLPLPSKAVQPESETQLEPMQKAESSRRRKRNSPETVEPLLIDGHSNIEDNVAVENRFELSALSQNITNEQQIRKKKGRPKKGNIGPIGTEGTSSRIDGISNKNKFNWFEKFPIADAEKRIKSFQIPRIVYDNPECSFVLPIHERHLLILPYMDTGRPDWLIHELPEKERFLFPDPDIQTSDILTKFTRK